MIVKVQIMAPVVSFLGHQLQADDRQPQATQSERL
jgi:hypothetical protein